MELLTYVRNSGGTGTLGCPVLASLAGRCSCSYRTLYMIALGHKKAGPLLARRIATATGISLHDLRPDVFGEAANDS